MYIALNTNVSKRFTNILLPWSLDTVLARTRCVHNLHSLGNIPARRYLTLKNCLTNNDGRIPLPGTHLEKTKFMIAASLKHPQPYSMSILRLTIIINSPAPPVHIYCYLLLHGISLKDLKSLQFLQNKTARLI